LQIPFGSQSKPTRSLAELRIFAIRNGQIIPVVSTVFARRDFRPSWQREKSCRFPMQGIIRFVFIATKERKERRDNFFAIFVFYCG
jgi:hypothetical protein